jgi:thiol-disulfide isomerase/thioredoxin
MNLRGLCQSFVIGQVAAPALVFSQQEPRFCDMIAAVMRRCSGYLVILVVVFSSALVFAGDDDEAGKPAPRFRAKTTAGETFNNESVKGKVVLLEFWTTWCKYCHQEEGLVEQVNRELSDKGLIVLAIDVAESKKLVQKYLQQHPRACRIVLTEDTNLAAMYQANSYPIYVVIDRDGNISAEQHGAGGERALRRLLATAGLKSEIPSEDEEQ